MYPWRAVCAAINRVQIVLFRAGCSGSGGPDEALDAGFEDVVLGVRPAGSCEVRVAAAGCCAGECPTDHVMDTRKRASAGSRITRLPSPRSCATPARRMRSRKSAKSR